MATKFNIMIIKYNYNQILYYILINIANLKNRKYLIVNYINKLVKSIL
jgi:hypothetical protein